VGILYWVPTQRNSASSEEPTIDHWFMGVVQISGLSGRMSRVQILAVDHHFSFTHASY